MLENYLDIITNMENYVDGVMVVNDQANIVYLKKNYQQLTPMTPESYIGRNLFDLYPEMDPQNSTIMKALSLGEVTINYKNILKQNGKTFVVYDDTFPIRENEKVIGAVCITHSPDRMQAMMSLELHPESVQAKKDLFTESNIIGRCEPIQILRNQILRLGQTSSSVLIYGETGTGKEMVAQSIHSASSRKNHPFITQNCAAIPASLLESLFFGTVKGSYTGAEDRVGIFETASGGTVFLDEINSMDMNLQAKLLRVLEEKKITRIGSTDSQPVDVRIIAALNKPPVDCIREETLRPDLFYRLGSVTVDIPPLRDRGRDIELLTEYYVAQYNAQMKKNILGVSQDVMSIFRRYRWPGNVREFKNVIEGAFNLCDTPVIGIGDLPSYLLSGMEDEVSEIVAGNQSSASRLQWLGSLKKNMDAYEKSLIMHAISTQNTLTAAASYLGISRQSLNQKIHKYQLSIGRRVFDPEADITTKEE
ncbi:MAG: sigma-54 interaction domain-containing protein [Anaerovoracaceae bacterium]